MEQFRRNNEEYKRRYSVVAECPNPKSKRSMVGTTFWRNGELDDEALQSVIDNAREKIRQCPPCADECQLRNIAKSTPSELRSAFFPPRLES